MKKIVLCLTFASFYLKSSEIKLVNIKTQNKISVPFKDKATVLELKNLLAKHLNIPAEEIRLIIGGMPLNDKTEITSAFLKKEEENPIKFRITLPNEKYSPPGGPKV